MPFPACRTARAKRVAVRARSALRHFAYEVREKRRPLSTAVSKRLDRPRPASPLPAEDARDDLLRGEKARRGGHEGDAADQPLPFRHKFAGGGEGRRGRIHRQNLRDARAPELPAHDAREGAAARLFDVGDAEIGGEPVARAHTGEHGRARRPRRTDEGDLVCDGIDAVRHEGIAGKVEQVRRIRPVKDGEGGDGAGGVDVLRARGHHLRLVFAEGGVQGDELAVQVALRDGIPVHEGERAHARTHERLRRVRAHPADAEHGDVRTAQFLKIFLPDERKLAGVRAVHTAPPLRFYTIIPPRTPLRK